MTCAGQIITISIGAASPGPAPAPGPTSRYGSGYGGGRGCGGNSTSGSGYGGSSGSGSNYAGKAPLSDMPSGLHNGAVEMQQACCKLAQQGLVTCLVLSDLKEKHSTICHCCCICTMLQHTGVNKLTASVSVLP